MKTFKEYQKLVEELIEHDRRYYDEARPVISDLEYDKFARQLKDYEEAHPEDVIENSPARRVAESPTEGFKQEDHMAPMMSLANTYSEEEVDDFLKRVYKLLEKKDVSFCSELKMDGIAISIRYKKGRFFRALTRGNGRRGDNVSANIKTISSLPQTLSGAGFPEDFEVRGEVYLSLSTFRKLNREREEAGLEPFANPRNAAAGSLKLLDPKEVAKRKLEITCYGVSEGWSPVKTQKELFTAFRNWGLPTATEKHIHVDKDLKGIMRFAEKIQKERGSLPFEIDGVVVKVNDFQFRKSLGATGKTPRFAIAYKFAPEQARTKILDITVQVGRTGVLTPVAELEPVLLSGSKISRTTLHNQDEVSRKDIRIGDTVVIEKGGDVIPKVVEVDFSKRGPGVKIWKMPKKCPICKETVIQKEEEVAIRCPNPSCFGKRLRKIAYFASKKALDIEHLGEKVVEQLVTQGLVSRISDIYLLSETDLLGLEGFKEKAVQNLLNSIEASKQCSLSRLIMGLGIPFVGTETADELATYARGLDILLEMSCDEFNAIEGIGDKTAQALSTFFQDKENREEIARLLSHGVSPKKMKEKIKGHPFEEKTFVLTGTLENYTREEAAALIKERGGKVSGSVSKKTDYVLVGNEAGSKYDKAIKLGVPILEEEAFEKMCGC